MLTTIPIVLGGQIKENVPKTLATCWLIAKNLANNALMEVRHPNQVSKFLLQAMVYQTWAMLKILNAKLSMSQWHQKSMAHNDISHFWHGQTSWLNTFHTFISSHFFSSHLISFHTPKPNPGNNYIWIVFIRNILK